MRSCNSQLVHATAAGAPFLELRVREDRLLQLLAGRQLAAEDLHPVTPGARRRLHRLLLQSLRGGREP